jgi:phage terminase Nu1 subunit (DNA packaging protein)
MTSDAPVAAIRLLRRQFDFATAEFALARLGRLESLLADIEAGQAYPADWLVYRVTGVTPEASSESLVVTGGDLLAPLVELLESLHRRLGPFRFDPETDVDAAALAGELGVSRRTLQRWRLEGLPMLRFRHADHRSRVGCRRRLVDAFVRRHPDRIAEASRYRRIDEAERHAIVEAFHTARSAGASVTAAIDRAAVSVGRSSNAIRAILQAEGADAGVIPRRSTALDAAHRRRFVHRASARWIPASEIAARLGRSQDAVRRLDLEVRLATLSSWMAPGIVVPNADRPEAAEVFAVAGALDGLARDLAQASLGDWLGAVREQPSIEDEEVTRGRIAAMHFVHARAYAAIVKGANATRPGFRLIDPIESDLRWWGLLLERSVLRGAAEGLRRLEQTIGRRIEHLPRVRLASAIHLVLASVTDVVRGFDPTRRVAQHTLDRAVALGVGRRLARETEWGPVTGALSRGGLDDAAAIDTLTLIPEPARSLLAVERWWRSCPGPERDRIAGTDGGSTMLVRFGLDDAGRPRPLLETGRVLGTAPTRLVADLDDAVRALRRSAVG